MEPLLSIQLFDHLPFYRPGDVLKCDYQIDAVPRETVQAVEASVIWYTDGKGDEDLGVHFFERRVAHNENDTGDLRVLWSFSTPLPQSPLSYRGGIIQVHWCVRVRAFMQKGKETTLDHPFLLGKLIGT